MSTSIFYKLRLEQIEILKRCSLRENRLWYSLLEIGRDVRDGKWVELSVRGIHRVYGGNISYKDIRKSIASLESVGLIKCKWNEENNGRELQKLVVPTFSNRTSKSTGAVDLPAGNPTPPSTEKLENQKGAGKSTAPLGEKTETKQPLSECDPDQKGLVNQPPPLNEKGAGKSTAPPVEAIKGLKGAGKPTAPSSEKEESTRHVPEPSEDQKGLVNQPPPEVQGGAGKSTAHFRERENYNNRYSYAGEGRAPARDSNFDLNKNKELTPKRYEDLLKKCKELDIDIINVGDLAYHLYKLPIERLTEQQIAKILSILVKRKERRSA